MKIRQAKKILCGVKSWKTKKRFALLRPPYIDEHGRKVYPSWHDIDIIARARTRYMRYIKKNTTKIVE